MKTKDSLGRMYGVGIMAFILLLSTLVGTPVLPHLSEELGADATEIPIVVSAALATVVVVQSFTGFLADRYSKRTLILIGALLGSVTSLLCAASTHWTQLAIFRVFGGIADAIAMPALLAITASLGAEQPGKFFGILRGSQGISFVVGPMVGSALSFVSLRAPFVVDGVLSLCAFLAAIALIKDTGRVKSGHDLRMLHSLGLIFSDKRVYLYLLMGISGLFGFGILSSFVPAKAQFLGMEAWQIGLILSGGAILFSFVSYVIGTLSDKYGRRTFVIVSQVIIVIAGIGLIVSDSFAALAFFYGVFCVGETITFLLCFVYAAELFDQNYIGTFMGAFDSLMDLSLFVGPLLAVSVYKSTDQLAPVFLIAVTPAIFAFFATARWLPRETLEEYDGEK